MSPVSTELECVIKEDFNCYCVDTSANCLPTVKDLAVREGSFYISFFQEQMLGDPKGQMLYHFTTIVCVCFVQRLGFE